MELQKQMEKLETSLNRQKIINIALAGVVGVAVFFAVKPHGVITCDGWRVVDKDGKVRIVAATDADGEAGVAWYDKDGKVRIGAATYADGQACVQWLDKDEKQRITASTLADGQASELAPLSWTG